MCTYYPSTCWNVFTIIAYLRSVCSILTGRVEALSTTVIASVSPSQQTKAWSLFVKGKNMFLRRVFGNWMQDQTGEADRMHSVGQSGPGVCR